MVAADEPVVVRGPRFRIEADALHSKTYVGRIDLGTYSLAERNKGRVDKRLEELAIEGYKNLNVREVLSDD